MTPKERSDSIIKWLKTHPAIKATVIEVAAGVPTRLLKDAKKRGIPEHHIEPLIKELRRYGYK